jgi:sugar phosphate isomerase/epimerase
MTPGLSIQLYTLRDSIDVDLRGTLRALADRGLREVELYRFPERVEDYAELLGEVGLTAPTVHARLLTEGVDVDAVLTSAAALGVETVIDPYIGAERWATAKSIGDIADGLNEIAKRAAAFGLTIGYHNHWWETECRIEQTPALEVLADRLVDGVVLEVDTYWALVGGVDPVGLLNRLGSRVTAIHVKDGALNKDASGQTALGRGGVPIADVLAAAPHARRVVELDHYEGDIWEAVDVSLDYLRSA